MSFLYDVDTPLIMCFHRPSKTLILPVTSGSLPFAAVAFYPPCGSRFLLLTKSARCDILLVGFKLSIISTHFLPSSKGDPVFGVVLFP